jgi:hypothetical protein
VSAGVSIELEALNMSMRALMAHLTGEDPLRDSPYYGGPAEEGAVPEPPSWVNEAGGRYVERSGGPYPPPPRDRMGSAAGAVVIATVVSALTVTLFVLYLLVH